MNIEHVENACFEIDQDLILKCRICQTQFYFNNKLHWHFKKGCLVTKMKAKMHAITIDSSILVVHSERKHGKSNDLIFRSRQYAKIKFFVNFIFVSFDEFCVDSDTFMIFADKQFVINKCLDIIIRKTATTIKIWGIKTTIHDNFEYVVINFYIFDMITKIRSLAHIKKKMHLIRNLKINVFLKVDVLIFEKIILNFGRDIMIIFICKKFVINMIIMRKIEKIIKSIKAFDKIIIFANFIMSISMHIRKVVISNDINYSFLSKIQFTLSPKGDFFAHVIESKLVVVQIKNAFNMSYMISKNFKISKLHDYSEEECYMTRSKYRYLTIVSQFINIKESLSMRLFAKKTILQNKVTVYDDAMACQKIAIVVEVHSTIWNSKFDTINISSFEWMKINTISKTKSNSFRVFKFDEKDKAMMNKEFDLYQKTRKMSWTMKSTSYAYSVFMIWTTVRLSRKALMKKNRVMMNIRGLNKISKFDAYLMSLQSDIISCVQGCQYIFVMDCVTFFHQWSVVEENRHKFIVIIHRGSKQWNVAMMKYRNTTSYVQRKMNNLLKQYRSFCKMYIDDVIVFSHFMNEHVCHLKMIFSLFAKMNIVLKSTKTYFDYFIIALLKQKINNWDFTTFENKFKTITNLLFSRSLKNFKTYLNMIKWLRNYISYYAQKAEPLQRQKITLLKNEFTQKTIKKKFSKRILLKTLSNNEIDAYNQLQADFSRLSWLTHFDKSRVLYADVNASKSGFGVMMYHVKNAKISASRFDEKFFTKKQIDFIMFLNKIFISIESRYWSTELKMADLMWTIKRITHMIKLATHSTVIYIDHEANSTIIIQTKLNTINIDKLNLKLIKTFIYLLQSRLTIRHRLDKTNVILNALSRLSIKLKKNDFIDLKHYHDNMKDSKWAKNYALNETLIIIDEDFKKQIMNDYIKKKIWTNIIRMLKILKSQKAKKSDEITFDDIEFVMWNEFIYHHENERIRLCIFENCEKDIFNIAHDQMKHMSHQRFYQYLKRSIYMLWMTRKLHLYIKHCSSCQLNQTKRHKSYEELNLIKILTISFHIIVMNFIMIIFNEMNIILIIFDKRIKRKTLISDKTTYTAKQWIDLILKRFLIANWKIFQKIISNRNQKFMFDFWK